MRLSILTRSGGRPPPRSREGARSRPSARLARSTPAHSTRSSSCPRAAVSSSARSSDANSEQSGCRPSARAAPDLEDQVELRVGALADDVTTADPRCRAPQALAAERFGEPREVGRRQPLGARVGGMAELARARRAPRRGAVGRAGRQRQRARERLAPVGERGVHERDQRAAGGAGARAAQHDERGLDVRRGVEDRARNPPQDAHVARQLREHRGRAVGLRRPAGRPAARRPRAGPSPPTGDAPGSSSIDLSSTVAATP